MDWKDALSQLKDDPSLPPGEEISEQRQESADAHGHRAKERLHVSVERKGRKGKTATIIDGFTFSDEEVAEVAATLKKRLGVGGSSRGGEILIQGECRDKVAAILREMGFTVK